MKNNSGSVEWPSDLKAVVAGASRMAFITLEAVRDRRDAITTKHQNCLYECYGGQPAMPAKAVLFRLFLLWAHMRPVWDQTQRVYSQQFHHVLAARLGAALWLTCAVVNSDELVGPLQLKQPSFGSKMKSNEQMHYIQCYWKLSVARWSSVLTVLGFDFLGFAQFALPRS
jgi:hypothetical protein